MAYKDFRTKVIFRVILLGLATFLLVYLLHLPHTQIASFLVVCILAIQLFELFHFVNLTNRKLTRFLESIKYSDFISGFSTDSSLGKSFRELNTSFNDVMEAFRKARSEKEEHWQYLNTIVQQLRTGLISFDEQGQVELVNATARKMAGLSNLKNIEDLVSVNPPLYQALKNVQPGKSQQYRGSDKVHLTVQATELHIRGKNVKIVTLQNIQTELQERELEAWRNLTRVLRHEIMNSITPISSLTSTLLDVLKQDLVQKGEHYELKAEGAEDIREGLQTIDNRSRGLIKFIDAYREYTSLPKPKFVRIKLKDLLDKVAQLMAPELKRMGVAFHYTCSSDFLTIHVDEEMVSRVLINLIKNAMEALTETPNPQVRMTGQYDGNSITVEVIDNGPGIIEEAIEQIFVPFYTTKRTGSGIGLSLSRQIMQMHNGTISVHSEPEAGTVFILRF